MQAMCGNFRSCRMNHQPAAMNTVLAAFNVAFTAGKFSIDIIPESTRSRPGTPTVAPLARGDRRAHSPKVTVRTLRHHRREHQRVLLIERAALADYHAQQAAQEEG